ncbi:cyclase [bacterium DOLZORAL124_38_8]|nr:MAG: cyclase [bacterium DOLZORAL124_38_8]
MKQKGLWKLLEELQSQNFVDLTHSFYPGIPHASDMPDQEIITLYDFENNGFQAHYYKHVGQWGTHIDPPIHFVEGGRSIDQIEVSEMLLPLVCFDCLEKTKNNSDFVFSLDDLIQWESINGQVPPNAFAVMKTGWAKYWPSNSAMLNKDSQGICHFPGWGMDAVKFLIEERNIKAFGHETTDTDGGKAISNGNYSVETFLLEQDCFQIELLAETTKLPETGAIAVVSFPKPKGGSGYPARVFALYPNEQ